MSTHRIVCYVLDCDYCRVVCDETSVDGVIAHFDTEDDALDYATTHGWIITGDGQHLCHSCARLFPLTGR